MIPYSLHVAILLAVCWLFYKTLLQKETYYHLNRVMLLACLALAFVLPLVSVPQKFSLRNVLTEKTVTPAPVIVHETAPVVNTTETTPAIVNTAVKPIKQVVAKADAPVFNTQTIIKWVIGLYWFGVAAFGANFLLQIVALFYQAYKKPVIRDGKYRIVELDDDKAPCSFGNNIFINPAKYDFETYQQILLHEQVHIQQGHSFDLVIAELMLVLQWFNPFAWFYRKEMETNLEFFTDDSIINQHKVEAEQYQLSLLKVSVPNFSMRVTTNYNQSLLKKRIIMMNAKRSNIHTSWKYFMLAPLLVILVCGLNKQVANSSPLAQNQKLNNITLPGGKVISFQKDTTINMKMVDGKMVFLSATPSVAPPNNDENADAIIVTPEYVKSLKNMGYKNITPQTLQALAEWGITPEFVKGFQDIGYKNLNTATLQSLKSWNITPEYVKGFQAIGYDVSLPTLEALSGWGITPEYIKSFKDIGYDTSLPTLQALNGWGITPDYIQSFKAIKYDVSLPTLQALNGWGITPDYIKSFKAIKYDVSLPTLQALNGWGITPAYIKGFKDIGYNDVSLPTLQAFISSGVTPKFIKGFMDIGYKDLSAKTLQGFSNLGVTPAIVKGFSNFKELPGAKITANSNWTDVEDVVVHEPVTAESTDAFKPIDYEALRDNKLEDFYRQIRKYTLVLKPIFNNPKLGDPSIKPDMQSLENKLAKANLLYSADVLKNAKDVAEMKGYPNLQKAYAAWALSVQNLATYTASEAYLAKVQKMSASETKRYQYYIGQMEKGLNYKGIK